MGLPSKFGSRVQAYYKRVPCGRPVEAASSSSVPMAPPVRSLIPVLHLGNADHTLNVMRSVKVTNLGSEQAARMHAVPGA